MYILKLFFNFSYLMTVYPVDALHFTLGGIHIFFFFFFLYKLQGKYVIERYSLGARNIYFP